MNLRSYTEAALWVQWLSQGQGVMRGSDILRPTDQRARKWDPDCETQLNRIAWETFNHERNHGFTVKMRWTLKPTKIDQAETKGFR